MKIKESFEHLENYVKNTLAGNRRHLKKIIIFKIIVFFFIICYLTWAYNRIARIDADVLVATAQQKIYQQLPSFSHQLSEELKNSAPDVMETLKQKSLEMLPYVGNKIEDKTVLFIKDMRQSFKEQVNTMIDTYLKQQKEKLDIEHPELSDKAKLDLLLDNLRSELKTALLKSLDNMKAEYKSSMNDLNSQLERLSQDDSTLSEKEVLQKRIIEIWLKLVQIKTSNIND